MNRTIKERKEAGECKGMDCGECEYCIIHFLLGIACGKEYPAEYRDILRDEEGDWEE